MVAIHDLYSLYTWSYLFWSESAAKIGVALFLVLFFISPL